MCPFHGFNLKFGSIGWRNLIQLFLQIWWQMPIVMEGQWKANWLCVAEIEFAHKWLCPRSPLYDPFNGAVSYWNKSDKINVNLIIDSGALKSHGGLKNIARICNSMGYMLGIAETRSSNGWSDEYANPTEVIYTRCITVNYINGNPTTILFDVV